MIKLSIVIVVFNKWNFTKSCLDDLAHLSNDHEIIVIDNASSDLTHSELSNYIVQLNLQNNANFVFYRNEENLFHSYACNQGFNFSKGKNVLFLNNDIRVKSNHSNWTKAIIEGCENTNGLVGPTMGLLDKDFNFIKEANQQLIGNCYLGGWCVAANKKTWLKLSNNKQVWNEDYPMYFNDTDLSFRAKKLDIPLTVIPLSDVVHFGKISASQINVAKLYNEGRKVFLKQWAR